MPIRRSYGRKIDTYDPRDQRLHVGAAAPVPIPDFYSLCYELGGLASMGTDHMPPPYDQGHTSSCVGNGVAGLYDYVHHKQGFPVTGPAVTPPGADPSVAELVAKPTPNNPVVTHSFLNPSRLAIYYGARQREGSTGSDDGAEIRDGIQAVVKDGAAPETLWPFDPAKVTVKPSPNYYQEARQHQALNYTRVSQADYYIGHTLAILGLPIVFGMDVFEEFESDEVAKTGMVPMPAIGAQAIGGHCMVIVARDAKRDLYGVRNSWGPDWGLHGYCWIPRPYLLNNQLASDAWTIVTEEA